MPEWLDTAHVAAEALQRRPDLQSAHAEIDATRWGIRRAANENMPALSVGFTVYSTGRVFDYATQDGVSQIATPQPVLINQIGPQTSRRFLDRTRATASTTSSGRDSIIRKPRSRTDRPRWRKVMSGAR